MVGYTQGSRIRFAGRQQEKNGGPSLRIKANAEIWVSRELHFRCPAIHMTLERQTDFDLG